MNTSASMFEIINQLDLFSKTVSRIHNSDFIRDILSRDKIGFTITSKTGEKIDVMKRWPEENLVNGFLLPFRMLIQKNDPCSWRQICELVETLDVPSKYKDAFRDARINLNDYLDGSASLLVQFPEAPETTRELLNTFLYGYYAHADQKFKKKLEQWKKYPWVFDILEYQFIIIILQVASLSYRMSELINKPMIEFLRKRAGD